VEQSSLAKAFPELELSALELVDRLLDKGVVLAGEATISVAEVDLVYLGLNLVLSGVERLQQAGASNGAAGGAPPAPSRPLPAPPVGPSAPRTAGPAHAPPAGTAPAPAVVPPAPASSAAPRELGGLLPEHVDVDPDDVERGLAKLVLTVVELLRQVLERQAVRRMEGGSLTDAQVERMGLALLRLEERMTALTRSFGLEQRDLNLSLGPLGRLL
jgi:hypothetical protein